MRPPQHYFNTLTQISYLDISYLLLDFSQVWALLLLFLSQADTYIGRHSEPDLGLIKADSRHGHSFISTMLLLQILSPLQAGSSSKPSFDISKTQLQNSSVAGVQS